MMNEPCFILVTSCTDGLKMIVNIFEIERISTEGDGGKCEIILKSDPDSCLPVEESLEEFCRMLRVKRF